MAFLNPAEKETLVVVCNTLIPSLEPEPGDDETLFRLSATDLGIPDEVEKALENVTTPAERAQVRLVLRALNMGLFNGVAGGHWAPLKEMPQAAREEVLYKLATSRFEKARTAFLTFKRLASFMFYAVTPANQPNPTWAAINYETPPPGDPVARPIEPLVITAPTTLKTEVLIIGSGAGGGVVAGELARAGHEVMVIEKGDYYADHEYPRSELESMNTMYEKHGSLVTKDAAIAILAGSVLGGGTTVNWTASFRTPDNVLREWEEVLGFSGAQSEALQQSFDAVAQRSSVGTVESIANPNNQMLERGCQALGYTTEVVPRNVKGCEVCDFCNYGCQFGAKQGTLKTYLQDAYDNGAKIMVRGHVDRILHERGEVKGAVVTVTGPDGIPHNVTIKAKVVVVSAGTIHTPAVLLRSGLKNRNIGANLYLHPTTVTTGLFEETIEPWRGAPLTRVVRDFKNLDGNGYGVWLENAPAHPGLNGLALPWINGRTHKRIVQQLPNTANIIILTRDRDSGRVTVDKHGQPVVHYRLSDYDARHLMVGLKEALKIHVAAGALEVATPHNDRPSYMPGRNGSLEQFLARVEARRLKPNDFALFSAHQMSTARIDSTGQSWEIRNLYVADGSALPNAPGVNPMLTIMAVSHYIAQHIRAAL
ncbi:MAG: GMC family oxidoreductase N-terminal domain-containing protein [Chloroflexota bacterium]